MSAKQVEFVPLQEAAKKIGVTSPTLRRRIDRGDVRVKVGGFGAFKKRYSIHPEDVEKLKTELVGTVTTSA